MREEDGAFTAGLSIGAIATGAVAMLIATIRGDLPSDPLKPVLTEVSPDKLADEIAKDPKMQERWKAMREFVQSIDQQVGKNLEQAAGGSKETAQHWKDRTAKPRDTGFDRGGVNN